MLSRVGPIDWVVVLVGIEHDLPNEFAVLGDDRDMFIDDVETDRLAAVGPTDVEMSELAEVAQRDVAAHVDGVDADAMMRLIDQRVRLAFCRVPRKRARCLAIAPRCGRTSL